MIEAVERAFEPRPAEKKRNPTDAAWIAGPRMVWRGTFPPGNTRDVGDHSDQRAGRKWDLPVADALFKFADDKRQQGRLQEWLEQAEPLYRRALDMHQGHRGCLSGLAALLQIQHACVTRRVENWLVIVIVLSWIPIFVIQKLESTIAQSYWDSSML